MATPTQPAVSMPTEMPHDPSRQWKIDHSNRIDKRSAQILVGVFAGTAIIASACRLVYRLHHDRKLKAHDYLVLLATLTLIPLTGITYHLLPRMYVVETVNYVPDVVFSLSELLVLLETPKWVFIFFVLSWTAIFAVKFSFLVFFRPLIRNLSRWLEYYYWFTIGTTAIAYILLCTEPAMLCPHVGLKALSCYPSPSNLGLSLMVCLLDISTDLMIISFPVILLSMSRLRLRKKLGIAVFMCLSLAMIILTIIRFAAGHRKNVNGDSEFSMIWSHVLINVEASIAVIMVSVSAFRTIFAGDHEENSTRTSKLYRRVLSKMRIFPNRSKDISDPSFVEKGGNRRPQIPEVQRPGGTLQTLRNFVRRHGRTAGATTLGSIPDNNSIDVEDLDYHNYRRKETAPIQINVTHGWETRQDVTRPSAAGSSASYDSMALPGFQTTSTKSVV